MNLSFPADTAKEEVFKKVIEYISATIRTSYIDSERPWGGFLVIDEADIDLFIYQFFPNLKKEDLGISGKLSPKILLVAPNKRLSWQYHHRRAEIWKVIGGQVGIITSETDTEGEKRVLQTSEVIELKQGERHRLIGLQDWGIIAEIWRHTKADHPSDEEDIIRVQDDFGR
jgi:mannose-6-phosphate isomerase-like protein (cupin superfamily)